MSATVRTAGTSILGALAVPVGLFSGLAALGSLLILLFFSDGRTFGTVLFFLGSSTLCYYSIKTLRDIARRGRLLVESINAKESLAFNHEHMLGYPSPAFLVFDSKHQRVAVCNSVTGDYRVHASGYVLRWHYEWSIGTRMEADITGGRYIRGTNMREPNLTQVEYKKDFVLILEVSDENHPTLKFPMAGEEPAKRWCARLNAIFNGSAPAALPEAAKTTANPEGDQALRDIERYGYRTIFVLGEGDTPPFTYSMGITQTTGRPEIVIVGMEEALSTTLITEYYSRVRTGETFLPNGLYSGFLEGIECAFAPVSKKHYAAYFEWCRWLYGGDRYEVVQLIYPTPTGIWPDSPEAPDWLLAHQHILTDSGKWTSPAVSAQTGELAKS